MTTTIKLIGLPWWVSVKEFACQCRRHGFNPWVGKIPWRKEWEPSPVLLSGEFHGQRSLAGYSPWDHKESDTTQQLNNNKIKLSNMSVTSHSSPIFVCGEAP